MSTFFAVLLALVAHDYLRRASIPSVVRHRFRWRDRQFRVLVSRRWYLLFDGRTPRQRWQDQFDYLVTHRHGKLSPTQRARVRVLCAWLGRPLPEMPDYYQAWEFEMFRPRVTA